MEPFRDSLSLVPNSAFKGLQWQRPKEGRFLNRVSSLEFLAQEKWESEREILNLDVMNEAAGSAAQVYSLRVKSSVNLIILPPLFSLCHHLLGHIGVVYLGPPYAVNTLLQRYLKQCLSWHQSSYCHLQLSLLIMGWCGRGFNEKKLVWNALTFLHESNTQWLPCPIYCYAIISFTCI